MPLLGSILTHLVLAVTLVLAAAVAGLMAFHYVRARRIERQDGMFERDASQAPQPDTATQRVKSAEEIAQIRARIEALMEQQQVRSETQGQHLAQKLDEIRTHMNTQDRKFDGIKSELRHEIRRRDGELDELRHQLASALDAFWQSMPALPEGEAPVPRPALPAAKTTPYAEAAPPYAEPSHAESPSSPPQPAPVEVSPTHEEVEPGLAPAAFDDPFADEEADAYEEPVSLEEPATSEETPFAGSATGFVTPEPIRESPPEGNGPLSPDPFGTDHPTPKTEPEGMPSPTTDPPTPDWSYPFAQDSPADRPADPGPVEEEASPVASPFGPEQEETPAFAADDTWLPDPLRDAAPPQDAISPEQAAFEEHDFAFEGHAAAFEEHEAVFEDMSPAPTEPAAPAEPTAPNEPLGHASAPPAPPPEPAPALPPTPEPQPHASVEQESEWSASLTGGDGSAPGPEPASPPSYEPLETAAAPEPAPPEPAPVAQPAPEQGDDLTVISSITPELQRALYAVGVSTLDEIARWSRADARRIGGMVDVPEEVVMHQWIFEAQSVLFEQYQSMMTQ